MGMSIYQKLFFIQQRTVAPKDKNNDFGGFRYRNVEAILGKIKPLLKQTATVVLFDDKAKEYNGSVYVEATASLVDCETGERITATALSRESETKKGMDASQCTGCASTYARKYALCGLLGIDDAKTKPVSDPDAYDPAVNDKDKADGRKALIDEICSYDVTRKEMDEEIARNFPGKDADTLPVNDLRKLAIYYRKTKGVRK